MQKLSVYVLSIIFIFMFISCDTEIGDPPDLCLSFTIDGSPDNTGTTVKVSYTLKNECAEDLENCKILIGIDTTSDSFDNYNYKYWTDGVDLDKGKSHSETDVNTTVIGDAEDNLIVLAAGFDNAKSVTGRTVIYYYNE